MQTITISQAHYSDLQMSIAKLLKQVDDLKKQLANTLEIGSHLASNLQQQRDENERLRNAKPHYIAVATIDDWHYDGKHFPNCKCTANGATIEEAFYGALEYFGERYKLTDVPTEPCIGENCLYANNREVNIIITKC